MQREGTESWERQALEKAQELVGQVQDHFDVEEWEEAKDALNALGSAITLGLHPDWQPSPRQP